MTNYLNHALIEKIVRVHQDVQIFPSQPYNPALDSSSNPVYIVTKIACLRLGFIEPDAECLATAWSTMVSHLESLDPNLWPDQPEFFKLRGRELASSFAPCPTKLGLYIVAPDALWVKRLLEMGAKTVQLRFKSTNPELIEEEVAKAIRYSQAFASSTQVFINDYWELAIKYGAYGVHLGQEDMDLANLERIRRAGLRLGLSTHGYAEMLRADQYGPSYIALGAIFPTTLKQMATAPQGLGRLKKYAQLMKSYPLVGIGGVNETNIQDVLQAGVCSAALVRAVINSDHPEEAFKKLAAYF